MWLGCPGIRVHSVDDRNDIVGMGGEDPVQPFVMDIREGRFIKGLQIHDTVTNKMATGKKYPGEMAIFQAKKSTTLI
jgi:hypothetical protein